MVYGQFVKNDFKASTVHHCLPGTKGFHVLAQLMKYDYGQTTFKVPIVTMERTSYMWRIAANTKKEEKTGE